MLHGSFDHEEIRENVGAERLLQLFCTYVLDALLGVLFGGVIHQYVKAAKLAHRAGDRVAADVLVADIARDREEAPSRLFDEPACLLGIAVLVEVDDRYVSSFFGEGDGYSAPDAAVSTCDEGHLAFELVTAARRRIARLRLRGHF